MKAERTHAPVRLSVIFAAYYAVLVAFLVASFFPEHRIWGVNWWAYFPGYVPFVLFAIGAVAPVVMRFLLRRDESGIADDQASANGSSKYFIIVFCLTVLYALAFYLLRARTHFLGDGYQILSTLASDNPGIRSTEQGETLVHLWVKLLIGTNGETSALMSHQIVSISAGVLLLIAVALVSKWLFDRTINRVLFWLGLASGGYMLLFFGYVEHYSLSVLSVAVYSLMGLLVAKKKINRWLTLPVVILAIFFHILGVTLIPSAIYLLVSNSRLGNALAGLNNKTKLLMVTIAAVILVSLFYYFYSTDYFFRFALVPLFKDRFTVEGYTLFSSKHLLDYLNLLILLLPGLPLMVATLFFLPLRKIFRQREYRYLLVLLVSTLGAVFILNPRLGMPRDWDLFSFSGVPLAAFSYYTLLSCRGKNQLRVIISILTILIGFLSLFPRVVGQVSADISLAHFNNYILRLDKVKSKGTWGLLSNYYERVGNREAAQRERERMKRHFPEREYVERAKALLKQARFAEAIDWCEKALKADPICVGAYVILGTALLETDRIDSALVCLKIADGLNPYYPVIYNNLAFAYYHKKDYKRARELWFKALEQDSLLMGPLTGLARLYRVIGDEGKYSQYFFRAATRNDAPLDFVKALGDYHLSAGAYEEAAEAYRRALQKGLDSMYVKKLIEKYPQLKE